MTDIRGRRILRLLADPELHGDLLLIGMALAAIRDFGSRNTKFHAFAHQLWPERPDPVRRLQSVIAADARMYKPPLPASECPAPMQRRAGLCGQSARPVSTWLPGGTVCATRTDWETGEWGSVSACSRHTRWAERDLLANHAAKPDQHPLPLANTGGVLARHFPELNWYRLWAKFDPYWTQHPEVKPWPKPKLDVLLGEDDLEPHQLDGQRPDLVVLRTS